MVEKRKKNTEFDTVHNCPKLNKSVIKMLQQMETTNMDTLSIDGLFLKI